MISACDLVAVVAPNDRVKRLVRTHLFLTSIVVSGAFSH